VNQLNLFTPNFGSQIRRVEIAGVMHFSVLDVFEHYGSEGSADQPAKYWKRIKDRLEKQSDHNLPGLVGYQFEASDGRKKKASPVATFKFFMRIVQVSEIREWEPLRNWMADLAQERIEETANPALGVQRAQQRFIDAKVQQGMSEGDAIAFLQQVQDGRIKRNEWTEALKTAVIGAINYGQATNTEYVTLFGQTAKDIREATGFQNARDGMTYEARTILSAVEFSLSRLFRQREHLTFQEALNIIRDVCAAYRVSVANVEALLGIELATGKPLLQAGSAS
jgi:hypothetical protein